MAANTALAACVLASKRNKESGSLTKQTDSTFGCEVAVGSGDGRVDVAGSTSEVACSVVTSFVSNGVWTGNGEGCL